MKVSIKREVLRDECDAMTIIYEVEVVRKQHYEKVIYGRSKRSNADDPIPCVSDKGAIPAAFSFISAIKACCDSEISKVLRGPFSYIIFMTI